MDVTRACEDEGFKSEQTNIERRSRISSSNDDLLDAQKTCEYLQISDIKKARCDSLTFPDSRKTSVKYRSYSQDSAKDYEFQNRCKLSRSRSQSSCTSPYSLKPKGSRGSHGSINSQRNTDAKDHRRYLVVVKKRIANDWKDLGRLLNVDEDYLKMLEENGKENSTDTSEVAYQMLIKWTDDLKHPPSLEILIQCLKDLQREDIVEEILHRRRVSSTADFMSDEVVGDSLPFNISPRSPRGVIGYARERRQRESQYLSVKDGLVSVYMNLKIRDLPWVVPRRSHPISSYITPLIELTKKTTKTENILLEIPINQHINNLVQEGNGPVRILMEGPAGCGKTTLIAKLCYDWADGLIDFDIVLLLSLNRFTGSFNELLNTALGIYSKEIENDLHAVMEDKSKKILLCLDGYYEISKVTLETALFSCLKCESLSHVSIVLVSRPQNLWNSMDSFWDEKLCVKGMDQEQQCKFLELFSKSHEIPNLELSPDLRKYPLMILLYVALPTEKRRKGSAIDKMADLYQLNFDSIIENNLVSKLTNKAEGADHSRFLKAQMFNHIIYLGSIAEAFLENNYFTSVEMMTKFQDLGFFMKDAKEDCLFDKIYEPVHFSVIEFALAYSIKLKHESLENVKRESQLKSIAPNGRSTSALLVVPFLVEMLPDIHIWEVLGCHESEYNQSCLAYEFTQLNATQDC